MAKKKEVATPVAKEKKAPVKLKEFYFETLVSTGAYSNVKMEIKIEAEDLLTAINLSTTPIRKFHQEFFLMTERRVSEAKVEVKETVVVRGGAGDGGSGTVGETAGNRGNATTVAPTKVTIDGKSTGMEVPITEAFKKANKAVEDALTVDALEVVLGQVGKSSKLSGFEKDKLSTAILLKIKSINK